MWQCALFSPLVLSHGRSALSLETSLPWICNVTSVSPRLSWESVFHSSLAFHLAAVFCLSPVGVFWPSSYCSATHWGPAHGNLGAHNFIFWLQFPVHFPHLVYFLALSRPLLHFVCSRKYFYPHPCSSLVYCSELSPQGNFWYCISASYLLLLSMFHLTSSMQSSYSPFELS